MQDLDINSSTDPTQEIYMYVLDHVVNYTAPTQR